MTMRIGIGSTRGPKVDAIKELIVDYPFLRGSEVIPLSVPSEVSEQPISLDETIHGARVRAAGARKGFDLGIGIESGLFQVRQAPTGMMNVCVCVIDDGKKYALGFSSAFEHPSEILRLVREQGVDVSRAYKAAGFTGDDHLGSNGGATGVLTNGRLSRKEYVKQAFQMALIQLENSSLYTK